MMKENLSPWSNFKSDIPASVVVFLVAMPLCLGVALASGVNLYAGLISGIVGGIIVGALSGSPLGVSGPAAGLAVIVLNAIDSFGGPGEGFKIFLLAVFFAGIIQIVMGFLRAGIIAYYFPSSVVHGMLSGIGIYIAIKQIPYFFGHPIDPDVKLSIWQILGNTFTESISTGVLAIAGISLLILILWDSIFIAHLSFTKIIKGPLVVVVLGVVLGATVFTGQIAEAHMVTIPVAKNATEFLGNFTFPDWSAITNPQVYVTAIILAIVASLEGLLCTEASDKQDPYKRVTPVNRELIAQGAGNVICGLIGGIPVTQVIVRSSTNMQSGGKTKASTIIHGFLLLISIIAIPTLLNMIPKATLAAILMIVGYKLAKPALFKKMYDQGLDQFIPYIVTIAGILLTDLLTGIGLGMAVAIFIVLRNNYRVSYKLHKSQVDGKEKITIQLSEDVTFLNKATIQKTLNEIPDNTIVEIDGTHSYFIHHDVIEISEDVEQNAELKDITVIKKEITKEKEIRKEYFEIAE